MNKEQFKTDIHFTRAAERLNQCTQCSCTKARSRPLISKCKQIEQ